MKEDFLTKSILTEQQIRKSFVNPDVMDVLFFRLIENMTHEQAYDLIEQKHIEFFLVRKYKNFDSYRIAKHRRQRLKLKNP